MAFVLLLGNGVKVLLKESSDGVAIYKRPSYLQIDGDIRFPGVYPFDTRSPTLQLLIKKAGGMKGSTRDHVIMRGHTPVRPGTRITLVTGAEKEEFLSHEMDGYYKVSLGIPISLNNATAFDLIAIPGIGPKLANAIIQERARRGRFHRMEDLLEAKGINQGILGRVRPYLTL